METFETRTFGKWILCGEHAVLRGCPALVFPVPSCYLDLRYRKGGDSLHIEFAGEKGEELRLLAWGVLDNALDKLGKNRNELTGEMTFESSLPVGAGLGASAALCVAIGRWIEWKGWIKRDEVYDFCRSLEDLFHGESSGVDIAVSLSGEGIQFTRNGERTPVKPSWSPQWYLSYSGQRGVTSECVQKVKRLGETDPEKATRLDEQMKEAVAKAAQALKANESEGYEQLIQAIGKANDCFVQWGLTGGELGQHLEQLRQAGAIAVKPTGSGGGGYALSLWKQDPPESLLPQLLKL